METKKLSKETEKGLEKSETPCVSEHTQKSKISDESETFKKELFANLDTRENRRFSVPQKSEGFFRELKEEQIKLAKKVITTDIFEKITSIAGADQFYAGKKVICAIVVCDYKSLKVIEEKHAIIEEKIPYKSGFLFYRDGPAVIEAFNKLENKPDVLIVKGNGILHPRRIGMASQVGILLEANRVGLSTRAGWCLPASSGKEFRTPVQIRIALGNG